MKKIFLALAFLLLSAGSFAADYVPADQIRVRSFIDKEDILHIQGDRVWFTHVIGAFPGAWGVVPGEVGEVWPTYVNEIKWYPEWDSASKSGVFRIKNPFNFLPFEKLAIDRISVYLIDSTNSVATVLEYPEEANGWTLSIRMDNSRDKRAQWMDLEISWSEQLNPKLKRFETIETHGVPTPPVIVPPTVPSPTPVGRR